MKQFLKKLSLMLLVASLVLACVPAVVNALPIQTGRFTPVEKVTMHFPDRRDTDQRVRIERSELTSMEMLPLAEEGEYLTDIQDAAAVLRQGMQKRQDQISVLYQLPASEDVWVNAVDPIWEDAFGHTGDPTAGDYLLWQYGAYSISCGGYTDGVNNYYTLEFIIDYYTTREQETEVDAAVAQLLGSLDLEGKSDYEKLCAVYDWMCANIYYDYAHLDDLSYKQMFTAYAALIDRTSVCQGYAVLLYRLMLELGIDCRVITGDAGGPHAWNIVQLDGQYYNLDSTWDASWYQDGWEYNYFLRSDATFEGHFRDEEYAAVEFYSQYPMGDSDYTPTVAAEIASGAYGENVTWVLTDDGRLTISGYGALEEQDSGMMMPWFTYWETITSVVVESGITEIPAYTFEYLENVKTIELPDTLTSLTLNAFNDCGSLNHLLLPALLTNIYGWSNTGVPEFIRCESLTDVYYLGTEEEWLAIPNAGTVANRYAEMEIHFLRLYEDPPTCTESGTQSFYMFDDTSVYDDLYDLNKKVISEPAILEATGHIGEGEVVAPTCTEQGYTTYICTVCGVNVVDDVVEKDIRYGHKYENGLCIYCGLEDGAITGGRCGDHLYWNYYLGSRLVIYGEGPMYDYAAEDQPWHNFKGTMLSVEIRDGATSIGVMAFQGYAYITSLKLPGTVQQIGEKAFYDCIRLKSVTLKEGLQTIGDSAFRNCRSIESLNLPESLTEIGNYTFFGCDMLIQLQIGKNVTTIGNSAFPMNMMIFCYEGTPAYTYAVNHGSPFCVSPDDMPLGHSYVSEVIAPTCTEEGYTVHICSNCGHNYADAFVDALGHDMSAWVQTKAPTCTEAGEEQSNCNRCGHIETREVAAVGHNEVTDAAVAPTCTATGLTEGKHCDRCGEILLAQTEVAALGHNEVIDAAVAPTCTATGLTEGKHCDRCGEVLVVQTEVPATGHSYGQWYTVTEPSDYVEGLEKRDCQNCLESETRAIPATGHSHNYVAVVTQPTCIEDGYTTYTCSCGDSYVDDIVPSNGEHDWYVYEVIAPSCEDGYTIYMCSYCSEVYEADYVPGNGEHDWSVLEVIAPSCVDGYTIYWCNICGGTYEDDYLPPVSDHAWSDWTVVLEPTCSEYGWQERFCNSCGSYDSQQLNPTDEHSWELLEKVEPTCQNEGYTAYLCSICGTWKQDDFTPTTEHNYEAVVTPPTCTEDGYTTYTCTVCGNWYVGDWVDPQKQSPWIIVKAPSAEENGLAERVCPICGETEQRVLPPKWPAEPIVDLVRAFKDALNPLDWYVDSYAEQMAATANRELLYGFDYSDYLCVSADMYEAVLNQYFAVDGAILQEIRDNWVDYDTSSQTYTISMAGMDEVGLPRGSLIGYVRNGDLYEVYYCAVTYILLMDVLPEGVDMWNYANDLGWPETIEYDGMIFERIMDAYVAVTEYKDYGNKYTVEIKNDIVRVICREGYISQNLPDHLHLHVKTVVEPTCTEAGYTSYSCSCGDYTVESYLPLADHNYESVVVPPTCTEEGYTRHTCTVCGTWYDSDYVFPQLLSYWVIVKQPTAEEEGLAEKVCAICGETEQKVLPKKQPAEPIADLASAFRRTLNRLDHFYDLNEYYMAKVVNEYLLADFDYDVCLAVPAAEYEALLNRYFAVDEAMLDTIRTFDDPWFLRYDEAEQIYIVAQFGGMGGTMPPREMIGYVNDGNVYKVFYAHINYVYLADVLPDGIDEWDYAEQLGWPETIEYNGVVYENGPDGYYIILGLENYGIVYTVEVNDDVVRIISQEAYSAEDLPEHLHLHVYNAKDPTCAEQGYRAYTCDCGDIYSATYTDALGHDMSGWTQTKAPHCTEKGEEQSSCNRCGYVETREVEALGHNEVTDAAVAPTCTATGLTEGKHCDRCGEILVPQTEVPVTGHSFGEWNIVKEATEEAEGLKERTCQTCGHVETEVIAKLDHVHTYESVVTVPTCTEGGYTTYTCRCGDSYTGDETAALGHDMSGWTQTKAPTCTEKGEEQSTCSRCDHVETREVEALGHNEVTDAAVAPTCTATGLTEGKHCDRCGVILVPQEVVAALGHDMSAWAQTKAPTCTEKGEEQSACSRCDHVETREVEALSHNEVTDAAVAPTCTETGLTEGKHCDRCGEVLVAQTEVPATDHSFGEWYTVTEPGEYEDGLEQRDCANCDHSETRAIPAVGHTHSYEPVVTAPTCTEGGYTTYICRCGDSYVADEVPALGHNYTSAVTAPTCTEKGYITHSCTNCGASYTSDEVAALGHTWDDGIITREPTVEAEGEKTYTCTVCGETRTEALPKKEPVIYDTPEDDSVQIPENDCFEGGTTVTVEKVEEGEIFDQVVESMENRAESYTVFEFTASKDGEAVQPNGKLTVSFAIPADYSTNVALYYMDERGNLTKLEIVIDTENRTVTVELEHFSTYILTDEDTAPSVILGDANGDGKVNARDARLILRYAAMLITGDEIDQAAADFNGDGKVNARDARAILRAAAGLN